MVLCQMLTLEEADEGYARTLNSSYSFSISLNYFKIKSLLKNAHWNLLLLCQKTSSFTYNKIQTSTPWLINSYMIRPSSPLQPLWPYPSCDLRPFVLTGSCPNCLKSGPSLSFRAQLHGPLLRDTFLDHQYKAATNLSGTEFVIPYFPIFYLLLLECKFHQSRHLVCVVHFSKIIHKLIHSVLSEFMLPS